MNLAYFRRSNLQLDKTIANVTNNAKKAGWKVLGTADLPEQTGKLILICRPEWVKVVLANDYNLIGFLPCA